MTPVTTTSGMALPHAENMSKTLTQITTTERQSAPLRPVWLHVLSAGTWPGQNGTVTISPEDIQAIAASYNPALHEAPAVLGHPVTDDPAYGWVRSVQARDDGLWANTDLQPQLADMVHQQMYRKLSVSLYPPGAAGNPVPEGFYFKHLGFLGGQAPAVKGLKPVALAAADDSINIHFSEKETSMDKDVNKGQTVTLSEEQLTAKQNEITLAEQDITKRRQALRRDELAAKLTPHITAGRVLPSQKPLLIELAQRCDGQSISFSEGEQPAHLLEELDKFLGQLPAQVNFSEVSGADKKPPASSQPVNFSAPEGRDVDVQRNALHQKITEYSKKHGVTYVEAIKAVEGGL